jgi:hypothetical protein
MNVVLPYDAVRPAREADGVRQKFYRGTTGITKPRSLTLKSHSDLRRPFLTPSLMVSYRIKPVDLNHRSRNRGSSPLRWIATSSRSESMVTSVAYRTAMVTTICDYNGG